MITKADGTLKHVKDFTAQIQTLDIPGEVKAGYSPIGFVRCGRAACRITKINWKVGGRAGEGAGAVAQGRWAQAQWACVHVRGAAVADDEASKQGFLSKHSQCPL